MIVNGTLCAKLLSKFERVADVLRNGVLTEQRYISTKYLNALAKTYHEKRNGVYRIQTHLLLSCTEAVEERIECRLQEDQSHISYLLKVNNKVESQIMTTHTTDISSLQPKHVTAYFAKYDNLRSR